MPVCNRSGEESNRPSLNRKTPEIRPRREIAAQNYRISAVAAARDPA
jgi:hypothetical protein